MPFLLYADDLVLCGESEEDLRAMVGRFVEVCRKRGLKVNTGESKVILLDGEEGLECEVCINRYVYRMSRNLNTWDVFWTNEVQMKQSVVGSWRVGGGLQVLLGFWLMLRVCSLNVLWSSTSH